MGRQINFHMLAQDLVDLEGKLDSQEHIRFLTAKSLTPRPTLLKALTSPEEHQDLVVYLVRETDLPFVVTNAIEPVNAKPFWVIDVDKSPVLELLRSHFDGERVGRGRLYFQPGYYDESGYRMKSKEFVRWGDSLLRWIRRNYKKPSESDFYVAPYAWQWLSEGHGRLR